MKSSFLRKVAVSLFTVAAVASASAQITTTFNFDSVPSGSFASLFNTAQLSFHEASFEPLNDAMGVPLPGTNHWTVDLLNDSLFPVTVENPAIYGRGAAPSGTNALQALFQPVLIQFDRPYNVVSFSVTLDNDPFGLLEKIVFITPLTTMSELSIDESIPGLKVSAGGLANVSGIVLPAGAFYDNLSLTITAVPEPSTWGWAGCLLALGLAVGRRRRRVG